MLKMALNAAQILRSTCLNNGTTLNLFPVICNEVIGGIRKLHMTCTLSKDRDRRYYLKNFKGDDEGTEGERFPGVDASIKTKQDMFTDDRTPHLLFNGVKFKDVPICHIKVTRNNTFFHVTDGGGRPVAPIRTCGMEGFKNARKGTNVAAQATGVSAARKARAAGVTDVRVKIQGLGPGRASSLKGLMMGGLNIISITDDTRIPWYNMPRARKPRRI